MIFQTINCLLVAIQKPRSFVFTSLHPELAYRLSSGQLKLGVDDCWLFQHPEAGHLPKWTSGHLIRMTRATSRLMCREECAFPSPLSCSFTCDGIRTDLNRKHIQFQPFTPKDIVRISEVEVSNPDLYTTTENNVRTTATEGPLDGRMVSHESLAELVPSSKRPRAQMRRVGNA